MPDPRPASPAGPDRITPNERGVRHAPRSGQGQFTPIEIPKARRNPWAAVKIAAALLVVGGLVGGLAGRLSPDEPAGGDEPTIDLDRDRSGPLDLYVVETGSIESAYNTTVRNEVEALIGLVGGSQGATGKAGAGGSSAPGCGQREPVRPGRCQRVGDRRDDDHHQPRARPRRRPARPSRRPSRGARERLDRFVEFLVVRLVVLEPSSSGSSTSGRRRAQRRAVHRPRCSSSRDEQPRLRALSKPVMRSFTYMVMTYMPARARDPQAPGHDQEAVRGVPGQGRRRWRRRRRRRRRRARAAAAAAASPRMRSRARPGSSRSCPRGRPSRPATSSPSSTRPPSRTRSGASRSATSRPSPTSSRPSRCSRSPRSP